MWTHTLRRGFAACGLTCLLSAAGATLAAQGAGTPSAQADSGPFPRLLYGGTGGVGSLSVDCNTCSDWTGGAVWFGEADGGLDLAPSVRLLVSAGMADASPGSLEVSAGWALVGARLRPASLGGVYLQARVGGASVDMQRKTGAECDALCQALTFGLGGDVVEDVGATSGTVYELALGYDLRASRRVSLAPQVRMMLGQVRVIGLSLGISLF